ncbi:MAG: hypothetical protein DRP84_01600 [Spirochaetes bacterium]|nr:MAG: hypothetical protein DRP84_01600 [Spirochaetota bacterium]RKY01778.1 MAG: hypothetical protein DRP55_03750 [Spirochaetota bacterium]
MGKIKDNEVRIEILKGDITERPSDAIVNTSNDMLILGSGLGGAIRAKGGNAIAEELSKYKNINIGESVITSGGSLKTKYVIHMALSHFDEPVNEEDIPGALLNVLRMANQYGITTLSIPDISVGIVRVSPRKTAEKVFSTLKKFIETENKTLRLLEIVLWDIETLHIYQDVYTEIFE